MAFEIGWLESARSELDAEIEYVYSEFGEDSARRASVGMGCGVMASCIAATRCA